MKTYYVYILQCVGGSYFTDSTNNVEKRFYEHQNGLVYNFYTHGRSPVKIVCVENFRDIRKSFAREKQIKEWKRVKKEALIKKNINNCLNSRFDKILIN
jgi:putative endonuclease